MQSQIDALSERRNAVMSTEETSKEGGGTESAPTVVNTFSLIVLLPVKLLNCGRMPSSAPNLTWTL